MRTCPQRSRAFEKHARLYSGGQGAAEVLKDCDVGKGTYSVPIARIARRRLEEYGQ